MCGEGLDVTQKKHAMFFFLDYEMNEGCVGKTCHVKVKQNFGKDLRTF